MKKTSESLKITNKKISELLNYLESLLTFENFFYTNNDNEKQELLIYHVDQKSKDVRKKN